MDWMQVKKKKMLNSCWVWGWRWCRWLIRSLTTTNNAITLFLCHRINIRQFALSTHPSSYSTPGLSLCCSSSTVWEGCSGKIVGSQVVHDTMWSLWWLARCVGVPHSRVRRWHVHGLHTKRWEWCGVIFSLRSTGRHLMYTCFRIMFRSRHLWLVVWRVFSPTVSSERRRVSRGAHGNLL